MNLYAYNGGNFNRSSTEPRTKEVNDTLSHKMGDELITTVAEIIKRTIREQDFLVRLGGDEFFNSI
jgi:diguanylate cyclase (GGDEF)-like protein